MMVRFSLCAAWFGVPLGVVLILAPLALGTAGCGSDEKVDQYYGTDVGAGYVLPDGGIDAYVAVDAAPATDADAGSEAGTDAAGSADVAAVLPDMAADVAPDVAADLAVVDVANDLGLDLGADTASGG